MTFKEYLEDYADEHLKEVGAKVIEKHLNDIESTKVKALTIQRLRSIEQGNRDLFL